MDVTKVIRLGPEIATGEVYKIILEPGPYETEHSLHILINGSILDHSHPEEKGVSEGYREWNIDTCKPGTWEIVGSGFESKTHGVPFKPGIRIVEGSKRGPGLEDWAHIS